jgi:hypothetical protein
VPKVEPKQPCLGKDPAHHCSLLALLPITLLPFALLVKSNGRQGGARTINTAALIINSNEICNIPVIYSIWELFYLTYQPGRL